MGPQTALLEAPQQRVQGSVHVADRDETANSAKYYKPFIHRTVSFATLLAIALTLVALLEYASRVLPDIGWEGDAPQRRSLVNRRQESLELVAPSLPSSSQYSTTALPLLPTTTASPSADTSLIPSTVKSAYLDPDTTLVPHDVSAAASSTITLPVPMSSDTAETAYLDAGTTLVPQEYSAAASFTITVPAPTATASAYLDSGTTISEETSIASYTDINTIEEPAYLNTGSTIDETAYMGTSTTTVEQIQPTVAALSTSISSIPPQLISLSAYLETITVTEVTTTKATDYPDVNPSTTTSAAYIVTTITVSESAPETSYLSTHTSTQWMIAQATSTLNSKVQTIITTLTIQPPVTLSTTTTTATIGMLLTKYASLLRILIYEVGVASVAFTLPLHSADEISANKSLTFFTRSIYFCGAYLPILVAVGFRVVISWLYVTTKMLEPFRILTKSKTTSAKDFFNINYLSASDTFEPYKAMMSGHWLMLFTSLLYLAVELLSPFAAEILHFYWSCESTENNTLTCAAALWINVHVVRILQGLLSFTSMMLAIIWYMLRSRSSELRSDPSSITTVASLLHHPQAIDGLRGLDQLASKADTIKSLDGYSFRLGTYEGRDGNERYGLVASNKVQVDQPSNASDPLMVTKDSRMSASSIPQEPLTTRPKRRKPLHIVRDIVLGSTIAAILTIVAVYYVASGNSGFNIFMNSNSFGPRFLVTCVGVIIHTQWARLDRECAVDEPFRRLYRGSATAESTILPPRTLTPVSTFIASIYQRSFFVAHVTFVTLMSEVLIIVLPGVPFSPGEIWQAGMMSIYLSIAILGLMLLTFVALMLRPKGPDLPRKPNTLGAMCMYLCDSSMTADFADLSCLGTRARDRWVREKERLYCLKYDLGTDGSLRWQVDYDTRGEKGGALMSDF
ncbi:hypothetical protein MMC17_001852 [Xylographa soralifera]|nr:hypothetical protein [Xylographa soralifera]